jgi:hypothetical protein
MNDGKVLDKDLQKELEEDRKAGRIPTAYTKQMMRNIEKWPCVGSKTSDGLTPEKLQKAMEIMSQPVEFDVKCVDASEIIGPAGKGFPFWIAERVVKSGLPKDVH